MNIIVLMKRVPDLVEDLEVDDTGKALDEDCVSLKLNEFDDHALEEALLLKEAGASSVTAIALDGEEVDKMLFTALAKGADRALKICHVGAPPGRPGAGEVGDYRGLAEIFAGVVREQPHDLILTGVQAADERDGQLGPMVAALLDAPCVEVVTSVEGSGGAVTVHKEFSGGLMAEYEVDLPAVLGIQAARATPRYAPVSKVRQVQNEATIETVSGSAGGGSGVSVVEMTPPETGEGAQMLESVDELVEILESKGVI
ncbi:MAG: electron transfer flavoprotein subunit beta/FixA family protein [bacterium]|nr:electron transfer flavoprotein subunit beta/FixA family protein [bacterium]